MFGLISLGSSLLSGAVSAIGTACGAIGSTILSTGGVIIDALNRGLPTVEKVFDVAFTVGKALGVFSPEDTDRDLYELGMRAEQSISEGIDAEQFEDSKSYIEHIRNKMELNKDKLQQLENLSNEDKLKYAGIGSALTLAAIKEQFSIEVPDSFWSTSAEIGIKSNEIKPILDAFELAQLKPDLDGYVKGNIPAELYSNIYELIETQFGELVSDEILDKLLS